MTFCTSLGRFFRPLAAALVLCLPLLSCSDDDTVFVVTGPGIIATVAGTGIEGYAGDGESALEARFRSPGDVLVDAFGNLIICDIFNHRLRRVDALTGVITTIAGIGTDTGSMNGAFSGDGGPAIEAELSRPRHLEQDSAGNILFLDLANHRVRMIEANTSIITTVVGNGDGGYNGDDQPAVDASLNRVHGLAIDPQDNIYLADFINYRVRKVNHLTGMIATIAGTGVSGFSGDGDLAVDAQVSAISGGALDAAGNYYFSDSGNNRVRRIDRATGIITTVAGTDYDDETEPSYSGDGGLATEAHLNSPRALAIDSKNRLFIGDTNNDAIRMVDLVTGIITTVAGNGSRGYSGDGGLATLAEINQPFGIEIDERRGVFYIAEAGNQVIRQVGLPE